MIDTTLQIEQLFTLVNNHAHVCPLAQTEAIISYTKLRDNLNINITIPLNVIV